MALTALPELLGHAHAHGYAVGYFEAWDLDSLEMIAATAERLRSPTILGIGGLSTDQAWLDGGGIRRHAWLCRDLADSLKVPAAALLNEVSTVDQAQQGLVAGFNAAMIHTQGHGWDDAVMMVRRLAGFAHQRGAACEGEVGRMPEEHAGKRSVADEHLTTPQEAASFAEATKVDCLAVAVGNAHFVVRSEPPGLDLDRIRSIAAAVPVPLVLHGGSGLPASQVREAIAAGVTKVNVGTRLKRRYAVALTGLLCETTEDADVNALIGSRKATDIQRRALSAVAADVEQLCAVFGAQGRA